MKIYLLALMLGIALVAGCTGSGYWDCSNQITAACTADVSSQQTIMSPSQAGSKIMNYVNENFLNPQGATGELLNVSVRNGLYAVSFNVLQNGVPVQAGEVYSTLDGAKIIIGTMFDTNVSLLDLYSQEEPEAVSYPKTDRPEILLFVMSYCPYGNIAEEAMAPVAELLGNVTDIELHYVIYNSNYGYSGSEYCLDEEDNYCSMHGIQELNQGVRELCVVKYQPDKFWDFVLAMNDECDYTNADSCWQDVALSVGVDANNTSACEQDEALTLLAHEVELDSQYGAMGSPYLLINGVEYSGARTPEAYKQAICSAFNTPPAECNLTLSSEGSAASGTC